MAYRLRPRLRCSQAVRRQFVGQPRRQERTQQLAKLHRRSEDPGPWQRRTQRAAHQCLAAPARQSRFDHLAADVEQAAVLDTRRTGRLARTAGQAAVKVQAGLLGDRLAFEYLLDQIDAPARAVELVAEQLVGRAGRRAEAAMHATAQDCLGLPAGRRVADEVGEFRIHQNSAYRRPGLRMASGSKDFLRRRCSASRAGDSGAKAPSRQRSDSGAR